MNNKYIFYKRVWFIKPGVFRTLHHSNQHYIVGKTHEVTNCDPDKTKSYTTGFHVSDCNYWRYSGGDSIIAVEVDVDDIMNVEGKSVRVRKFKVLEDIHPLYLVT